MAGYGQFCPIAKACEVLGERWTLLVVRELLAGSRRYNDLKRGLPLISPTVLSQRLSGLQERGIIDRKHSTDRKSWEYHLTDAGRELEPIVMNLGIWGARWVRSQMSRDELDVELLMWDIRRTIKTSALPEGRMVLHVEFSDLAKRFRYWWLVSENGQIDLCIENPGYEVDIMFQTDLKTLTQVWMGDVSLTHARSSGRLSVHGTAGLTRHMSKWLVFSSFAGIKKAG